MKFVISIHKELQTNIYLFHRFSCMLSGKIDNGIGPKNVRERKPVLQLEKKVQNIGNYLNPSTLNNP